MTMGMVMEFLVGSFGILVFLGLSFLLLTSLFMPWMHRGHIKALQEEADRLKREISRLFLLIEASKPHCQEAAASESEAICQSGQSVIPSETERQTIGEALETQSKETEKEKNQQFAVPSSNKLYAGFEQQFGTRLPVWVGGIALALAGFFLVKYSIETGLLTESVRTVLGGLFGIGLLCAGQWMRGKPDAANGKRIAQALSGAGIADLYACLFVAVRLYHLIPDLLGFVGMGAVTATAVTLSLRHGAPIALLGLIGGFLTPALAGSSEPNAPLLFIYLYFVLAGLFIVIRRRNLWRLAIPTVIGAFLWVATWMASSFTSTDSVYLSLFLIAVSATVVLNSKKAMETGAADGADAFKPSSILNYLTLGGATLLMGTAAIKGGLGFIDWGLFGLLAAGGIVLACFDQKLYSFAPWTSMAVNGLMLTTWTGAEPHLLAAVAILFAAIYCGSGCFLMWRSEKPVMWAGLAGATGIGYYLSAYYRLHAATDAFTQSNPEHWAANLPIWGIIALASSLLATSAARAVLVRFKGDERSRQRLLSIFVAAAAAFLSIGLTIELKREFLSVAFAAQVLAISWINTRVNIKALRHIAGLLACVFVFLLIPQIFLLAQLVVYSLVKAELHLQTGIPIASWPLFQLGVPAMMFGGASLLLRRKKDDKVIKSLEVATIALLGVMGYFLARHAFHGHDNALFAKAGFAERGVITNILFLHGLACFWIGRRFDRSAASLSGVALSGIALFRIVYFDLLNYNPLWSHQTIGSIPLFNALFLSYGLPIAWLFVASKELRHFGKEKYTIYTNGLMMALIFSYVSLNVRQFYHGEHLDGATAGNGEIYAYSAAWLLIGIGLLVFGTLRQDKMIRIASLTVMILTVGKVFLYDASELEGLYRVFSFLGLGASLIALSWFYTRFVFGDRRLGV